MTISTPIRTTTESNTGGHWRTKHNRAKMQKFMVAAALSGKKLPQLPAIITLTRIGKKLMDKHDNLQSSMKHVVDQIARTYGVDDGSAQYTWRYEQKIGKQYGVEISIVPV